MQHITLLKLAAIHQGCDGADKSTEYMLQLMQDLAKVDLDTCIKYMEHPNKDKLFAEVNSLFDIMVNTTEILFI